MDADVLTPNASPALGRPVPRTDDPEWWRSAVIYQIYVRSFADGNGDGTGDLAGGRCPTARLAVASTAGLRRLLRNVAFATD